MSASFFSKLMYKRERVGFVEKDGKTYVKYLKVRRFIISKDIRSATVFVGFVLIVFAAGIKMLLTEVASHTPTEETAEGGIE
ncbi:MAG: hypothetical protein Q8O90_02590 [Elusimicrobiota bacterium]|nr:hypothetical protein [Elusimicrobiota bacterium]